MTVNVVPLTAVTVTVSALPVEPSSMTSWNGGVGKLAPSPVVVDATVTLVAAVLSAAVVVDAASGKTTIAAT